MFDFFKFKIVRRRVRRKTSSSSKKKYEMNKEAARRLVHARLEYFNQFYHFEYKKVFIKNAKTKWGSCSSNKNLNFNYKIVHLPPELQDYIVVHELCHLGQLNHSKAFWDLVGEMVPEHRELRKRLRRVG